ncbi:2654_t:CDS:2 [Entrophospora sp. SA101]|nr:2649_t:CDS:2 [Entrophospora sp. SA101]CAJ0922883.1 2654_t:CDS:2 [Entrophospora sp. SA101]
MAKKRKHNFIKKRKSIKKSNPKTNYKEKEKEKAILEPIYDEPPTFDDKPDIPRRFSRLLKIKEHRIKKVRDNVKTKVRYLIINISYECVRTGIERLPGEPFSKFSRRLEDHMRPEILKAFQEEIVDKPPVITVIPKNKVSNCLYSIE